MAGRDDPMGLFQPKCFCDAMISMVYLLAAEGQASCGVSGACPVPSSRLLPCLCPGDQWGAAERGLAMSSSSVAVDQLSAGGLDILAC